MVFHPHLVADGHSPAGEELQLAADTLAWCPDVAVWHGFLPPRQQKSKTPIASVLCLAVKWPRRSKEQRKTGQRLLTQASGKRAGHSLTSAVAE